MGPRNRASRQELGNTDLEKHESSPRLAARDGMEQEPYEFRIRLAKPGSEGEATHGTIRKHAFLASQKTSFERGPALRITRSLSNAADTREKLLGQEKKWAIKKTLAARRKAATSTTRNRSKFLAAWRPCACVPRCTSARPERWACTILFGKWWTTLSTKRWPALPMKSTSPCTRTSPLPWWTTAAAFPWTCTRRKNVPRRRLC